MSVEIGKTYKIKYPFVRTKYFDFTCEDDAPKDGWRPGVEFASGDEWDGCFYADGKGYQVLQVVDVHKPGKYRTRVFYTRSWIDPDGVEFNKPGLRIMAMSGFKNLLKGYRYPEVFEEIEGY